jgi:hypothetical protein
MRRPLSSTSVRSEVSPCSEIVEMPPVVAPAAELAVSEPELASDGIVCISCSTEVAPVFWICSRVMTCTGSAVSASMRLIDEPVISTRSSCCGGGGVAGVPWLQAAAGTAAISAASAGRRRAAASFLFDMFRSRQSCASRLEATTAD